MNGIINIQKINYVLDHLKLTNDIPKVISDQFQFVTAGFSSFEKGKIYFRLSESDLDLGKIKYINNIPILYPLDISKNVYSLENNYLIFHDDLLKSAFYFLSGYQEQNKNNPDELGRFHFHESVQFKLGITKIPVVNYYFEMIIDGINDFLHKSNSENKIQEKPLFKNFGFLLTHDVDRIKLYTLNNFLFKIKQIFGLAKNPYSFGTSLLQLIKFVLHFVNPFSKDPYWNFSELIDVESKLNLNSVWFFLQKNQKHVDSYYNFKDKKIQKLFEYLKLTGNEIGLHGTVQSSYDSDHFSWQKDLLSATSKIKITGTRQHRLMFQFPETAVIHSNCKIKYDSTMGFAYHEGFRNSYCLPFHLYNFDEEKAFETWEYPLNVMDNTLFYYRNSSFENSKKSIFEIVSEIKKFKGLFTLLWHNHYFDEDLYPGVKNFYANLLNEISSLNPDNYLGTQIFNKLQDLKES